MGDEFQDLLFPAAKARRRRPAWARVFSASFSKVSSRAASSLMLTYVSPAWTRRMASTSSDAADFFTR